MSLKQLLGLENTTLTDVQIIAKIKEARERNLEHVEFTTSDGKRILVNLPKRDFNRYIDPWDGNTGGRGNYPKI